MDISTHRARPSRGGRRGLVALVAAALVLGEAVPVTAQGDPRLAPIWEALQRDDWIAAEAALEEIHGEGEAPPEVYLLLGGRYRDTHRLAASATVLDEGIDRAEDHLGLRLERAATAIFQGDLRRAASAYRAALSLDPDHVPARVGLARVLGWRGEDEAALDLLDGVLETDPDDVEALVVRGDLHRSRLETGAARARYERALALAPDDEAARAGLAALDELTRCRLVLTGGAVSFPTAGVEATGAASLGCALDRAWTLSASYLANVPAPAASDPARTATLQHEAELALDWRATKRLAFRVAYGVRTGGQLAALRVHRLSLRVEGKVHPRLVLLGGLRPGVTEAGTGEALVDAGAQVPLGGGHWVMGQVFAFADDGGFANATGVATARLRLAEPVGLRLVLGHGRGRDGYRATQAGMGLTIQPTRRFEFGIEAEGLFGSVDRLAASAHIAARF